MLPNSEKTTNTKSYDIAERKRIHVTDRRTFKRCRRQWNYKCRGITPNDASYSYFWFGTGIHECLAGYYKAAMTNDQESFDFTAAWNNYIKSSYIPSNNVDLYTKIIAHSEMALTILSGYRKFSKDKDTDFKIIGVEKEIVIPIPSTNVDLVATIDLIVEKDGKIFIVDHKALKDFNDPATLELDDQMTAYMWVFSQCEEFGKIRPAGAIYNMLRKKIPSIPEIIKNGSVSRKAIDTTWEIYSSAVDRAGESPAEYVDMELKLRNTEFYRREFVTRSKRELETFEEQIVWEAQDMENPETKLYTYQTKDCIRDCQFVSLCKCQSDKGDVDYLIDSMFHFEEPRR